MKKSFLLIITLILLGGFLASCSANRGFVSNVTRNDIQRIVPFEIDAHFSCVECGISFVHNDSVTSIAKSLFEKELTNDKTLPMAETIAFSDTLIHDKVQNEIYRLMILIDSYPPVDVRKLAIPPTIDSILCSRNERFGLLVHNGGYYCPDGELKTSDNMLTACEGSTRSAIFIVDSELKNLAYVATAWCNSSPLKAETYRKQVNNLLKKYKK